LEASVGEILGKIGKIGKTGKIGKILINTDCRKIDKKIDTMGRKPL
jgi:hypothetical protein